MLHAPHMLLIEERILLDQHLPGARLQNILCRHASQHALAQRFDNIPALNERRHRNAVRGAAVDLGDDEILRHIDEAPREVARIGRLQRRVCEALAGAVGGDEVLQDVQTLAEVSRDRRFDDRAVGFGHKTAHARKLADRPS